MREVINNGELLHGEILRWSDDDFRDSASVTGYDEIGDFTSYLRTYPLRPTQVEGAPVWDEVRGNYYRPTTLKLVRVWPYDALEEREAYARPDSEMGLEVICKLDGMGRNPKLFSVISATAVTVNWLQTSYSNYEVDESGIAAVDLTAGDLLPRQAELSVSHGGYFHYYDHFLGAYVANQLEKHITRNDLFDPEHRKDAPGKVLADDAGNQVVLKHDGKRMTGRYYPAAGEPVLSYWGGGDISMMDRMNGLQQIMPGEDPFFNFTSAINGSSLNRGGYISFSNTDGELGSNKRVQRNFAAIVEKLDAVDIL